MNTTADMEILKTIKETEREFQRITDTQKIGYILDEYISNKPIFVKGTTPPVQVSVLGREGDNHANIAFPTDFTLPTGVFTLYVAHNKQMEFECLVDEPLSENSVKVTLTEARIATNTRHEKRYRTPEDIVVADNFLISKNRIDLNPFTYAVSNKVIFHEYERQLQAQYPDLKIIDLDPTDRSLETKLVKKHKLGAIIADTNILEEYENTHDELANLKELWKEDIAVKMKEYKEKGIKSVLIHPIHYSNLKGEIFPLGYFFRKGHGQPFTMQDYNNLNEIKGQIINRIKDANTIQVKVRQNVVNLGMGGLMIKVDDKEFSNYVVNRDDMTFDVVFKMQTPLRFYGNIRHIHQNADKTLNVGLAFQGTVHSEATGVGSRKRLSENLGYLISQGSSFEMN